jgi:iron-sulfur cluster repair protein YtfE (RIC family)
MALAHRILRQLILSPECAMPIISEFLQHDHHDLDERFVHAQRLVQSAEWDLAKVAIVRFARALREHIAMEQEILFPALATVVDVSGPCHVMNIEHNEIHHLLELLYAACRDHEKLAFNVATKQLQQLLRSHNDKEENILYPLADRVLANDAEELIATMRGMRAQTGSCGGGRCGCGHAA